MILGSEPAGLSEVLLPASLPPPGVVGGSARFFSLVGGSADDEAVVDLSLSVFLDEAGAGFAAAASDDDSSNLTVGADGRGVF